MPVRKSVKRKIIASTKTAKVEKTVSIVAGKSSLKAKLKQPKVIMGLIIAAVIIVAFLFKGLFVAALVNWEPITRIQIVNELEKQGGKSALASLINQALIMQEARKKNIQVSQSEIDASIKQIEGSLKSQGQSLDAALAAQRMTKQDLILQLKLRSLVEKLLADKVKVSDKEVSDYIAKNKESLPANSTEAEIKKSVKEQLQQQKLSTESSTWIEGLNKNSQIYNFVNY
jgi:hypothetical protein